MEWEGCSDTTPYKPDSIESRNALIKRIKEIGNDEEMWMNLELCHFNANRWELLNENEPTKYWAPLHYAANRGVTVKVIEKLVEKCGWRSLKDADGNTPLDLAKKSNHSHLYEVLKPQFIATFNDDYMDGVEKHFHELINERASELVQKHKLRLPQLRPVLENHFCDRTSFPVPGMYGGFYYEFDIDEESNEIGCLKVDSWCRVAGGSGQTHHVTNEGYTLVAEGFV